MSLDTMEITKSILTGRQSAKLNGDWLTYRKRLTKQIHNLRKKLGIATKPRAKCAGRVPVTTDDITRNNDYGRLLLLSSERAWANAMCMREVHSVNKRGITSATRSHIISKLQKATTYAKNLAGVLDKLNTTDVQVNDLLEAQAYAATLSGALEFEKRNWENCIVNYSLARIIYSALGTSTRSEIFKDLLSDPVDPSIRYCAYQMQLPRSLATAEIARNHLPESNAKLFAIIERIDAGILKNELDTAGAEADNAPKTITWRSHTINLGDSMIMTALASVQTAEKKLFETLSSIPSTKIHELASAYDGILTTSQDAVDATKHAIDELISDGVSQDDQRLQSLQVIKTAVSYNMISWRIARNRVLLGENDGIYAEHTSSQLNKENSKNKTRLKSIRRRLTRLQENVVLYDSILQSLSSIKDLAGVAADSQLLEDLDAKYEYFSSLRCLTIARSHSLTLKNKNALALLSRASSRCNTAHTYFSSVIEIEDLSAKISVTTSAVQILKDLLDIEVQRHRALVELSNLNEIEQRCDDLHNNIPLIERLSDFQAKDVNLTNLVVYPPVLESAPVKPLFFDAAWNYIRYPGSEMKELSEKYTREISADEVSVKESTVKKGWFGL